MRSRICWQTLQDYVHKNHQTQEQFFPPCRHSSEQLTDYYILLLYYILYLFIILNRCMQIFQFKYIESNSTQEKFHVCRNVLNKDDSDSDSDSEDPSVNI